jgi:hypothetical protein
VISKQYKEELMKKMSEKRGQLMQTGVFTLSYCFEDIYHWAPRVFQKAVDLMTDEELERFIDQNLRCWHHGIESGLCTDQEVVLSTCAMESVGIPRVCVKNDHEDSPKDVHPFCSGEVLIKGESDHKRHTEVGHVSK